jgi:hypothetical protein
MKSINSWDHLCAFGIDQLTGEACGLSYRILCDVTAAGKKILEKALGVAELRLHENWNRGTDDAPHVGSIMLAPELLPFVGVFALLEHGCREVWITKGQGVIGMEAEDYPEKVESFLRLYADKLARRFTYGGTAGDRNVHAMTGRTH